MTTLRTFDVLRCSDSLQKVPNGCGVVHISFKEKASSHPQTAKHATRNKLTVGGELLMKNRAQIVMRV